MGLKIVELDKTFGSKKVVDNISIRIRKGEVVGLLGTNGAGKTTTIKMILGLLKADKGLITWNEKNIDKTKLSIGYLPEERGLYDKSKIVDQLLFFSRIEGVEVRKAERRIDYWLEKLEITEYKYKRAYELSKGNQQKIQLIVALIHDPELLILDEPFSGLDPVNATMLSKIIAEQIEYGKTIVLSSHRMEQIESFCEKIYIMDKGKIVLGGNLGEIKQNYSYQNFILTATTEIESFFVNKRINYTRKNGEIIVKIKGFEESINIINEIKRNNIFLRNFRFMEPSLDEIFVEKVKGI